MPLRAHLVLLHVRHDRLLSPEMHGHHERRRSEQKNQQALHELAGRQPVPTEVETADDFLLESVAEAVGRHQPLLLVLGRPAPTATPEEVVTSAALDLLRSLPCPLLIVPPVGAGAGPPRRLALAVDGADFSLYDHDTAVGQLLESLPAELFILSVTGKKDPGTAAGHRALHSVRHSRLAPAPEGTAVHLVYHPHAPEGILQGAAELNADLLVVIARRHSFLGSLFHRSVTAQLLVASPLPVLLLPTRD